MTIRRLTGTDVLAGICVVLLVSATALALAANVHTVANRDLTVWGDRDLWRALTVGQDWPVSGPESNGGTPLPGGAFYLLLAAMLAIQPSLWAAQLGVVVLMAGATLLLGWVFWREVSPLAGALVAAAFVGSGLLPSVLMVWNPGYLPFFAALSTVTAYFALKTSRPVFVAATAVAIAVGMQIHLQMAWLLLALAVAAVLRPRSWSWRHGAAFLVGFLVPYLPSLTLEGIRLFLQAAATPNDAIANYAIDDFRIWPKLDLELTLLGGDGGVGADRAPGTMPEALLLLAGDLAAGLLVLVSLGGSLRRLFRRADAVLSLILLINIGVIACFYVYPRHVVVALPAVAVMTGLAGESVVRRLLRSNRVLAKAGAASLCLLIACRPLIQSHSDWSRPDDSIRSPAAQSEIATALNPHYFGDHESFESHTALFKRDGRGKWQLDNNRTTGQMAFVFDTTKVAAGATEPVGCVAIVPKTEIRGEPPMQIGQSPSFAGLSPEFVAPVAESPHFFYVPYRTVAGNCLKTFSNPYIPSAFEARHLPSDTARPSAGSVEDGAVFVIPQPGLRFPLGVEIRRGERGLTAILHGRLLRGYTGLYFRTLANPRLCLVSGAAPRLVSFGGTTVGSPTKGTLGPWQSEAFTVTAGSFRLWLTGFDPRRGAEVAFFLGELAVPALRATPPLASETGDPPPGCR